MKLDVIAIDAGAAGEIELADAIFGIEPRADILHRVVRWQRAKKQAGTHKSKSRGETASGPASASSSRATLRRAGGRGWDAGMGLGSRGEN